MVLGDFVEDLAAQLQQRNVAMPFENERPWHELFYELKRVEMTGRPGFFTGLRFDWDGPYPKCFELSEFLHALHWNACVDARNPHFDRITLPPAVAEAWASRVAELDPETRKFLDKSAVRATELFNETLCKVPEGA